MRWFGVLLVVAGCGRTPLSIDLDGSIDAGTDAGMVIGRTDAGSAGCVPLAVTPGGVLAAGGPRVTLEEENPRMFDGVMTPAGRVFAVLDPENQRVLLLGPGWQRQVNENTDALDRVHLAWNGSQLAMTWQAGRRLMFALFDSEGQLQHQRELADTTQQDEAVAGFAGGTWVPVWTHGISTLGDAWATRIYPDGGDQTLAQKVTNQSYGVSFPAAGISAIVNDAGITALVLSDYSVLAFTNLQPTHQREISVPGGRARGVLVDLGDAGLSSVYFATGPNSRRPDLTRVDLPRVGALRVETIAEQPALFSVHDVAAAECAGRLVVAYTDDTTGAGPCIGNYCGKPLVHLVTGVDGGDWRSPETDGGYVRGVALLRNGNTLDLAWLSARSDGTAQVVVAPSIVSCWCP